MGNCCCGYVKTNNSKTIYSNKEKKVKQEKEISAALESMNDKINAFNKREISHDKNNKNVSDKKYSSAQKYEDFSAELTFKDAHKENKV